MFDAYTLLGGIAARTQSARLGTLVTGVTYRNPALLAKAVTALDVISNGRALLGIGAAWYELEHESLGVRFPPLAERFERLEEALQICAGMFTQRQTTFAGTHYSVTDAWNSPAPVTPGGPPILVGGTGEQKTARLAATYADEWNCNAAFVELPRKLAALDRHLAELGRDRSEIAVSCLSTIIVGETHAEAAEKLARPAAGARRRRSGADHRGRRDPQPGPAPLVLRRSGRGRRPGPGPDGDRARRHRGEHARRRPRPGRGRTRGRDAEHGAGLTGTARRHRPRRHRPEETHGRSRRDDDVRARGVPRRRARGRSSRWTRRTGGRWRSPSGTATSTVWWRSG